MPVKFNDKLTKINDEAPLMFDAPQYMGGLKYQEKHIIGRCPFHKESSPSFTIDLDKNLYHCYGCGRAEDSIAFISEKLNLTIHEAVTFLMGWIYENQEFSEKT